MQDLDLATDIFLLDGKTKLLVAVESENGRKKNDFQQPEN